jgi:hypothetical protein
MNKNEKKEILSGKQQEYIDLINDFKKNVDRINTSYKNIDKIIRKFLNGRDAYYEVTFKGKEYKFERGFTSEEVERLFKTQDKFLKVVFMECFKNLIKGKPSWDIFDNLLNSVDPYWLQYIDEGQEVGEPIRRRINKERSKPLDTEAYHVQNQMMNDEEREEKRKTMEFVKEHGYFPEDKESITTLVMKKLFKDGKISSSYLIDEEKVDDEHTKKD